MEENGLDPLRLLFLWMCHDAERWKVHKATRPQQQELQKYSFGYGPHVPAKKLQLKQMLATNFVIS